LNTRQPNSRNCFVCGLLNPLGLHVVFENSTPGEVTAEFTVPETYQGYPGVVHGGIVAAMLDELAARSFMGVDPPRFMFTARLQLRYRKNVPVEQPLRLVGRAGSSRKRTAEATSAIYGPDGSLLAEGQALLVDAPPEALNFDSLDELGWRVYADEELEALRVKSPRSLS
jgi:acyl-coenzyme A thioesterase PaaI-like protein